MAKLLPLSLLTLNTRTNPNQCLTTVREPQKAVLSIQQDLDEAQPKAALFIDMAKAFEKVNPYWVIDTMLARGCPAWLVQYAMYLFTRRRVLHKVGTQLLPPRISRQGVDMGRAFSVFMFCLAMDPIYSQPNSWFFKCEGVCRRGYCRWLIP